MSTIATTHDKPVLGMALMIGFCVLAPVGDAVAKVLGGLVPIAVLLLVRFAVQFAVLLPMVVAGGLKWRMSGWVLRLTLFRTLLHLLGIGAMVTALQHLPLADAVAIAFVLPFIMLILGHFVLGEEVGLRRVIACAVGFIGTLMVIQPSFAEVGWHALWPLGVAVNFAVFILVTRQIAKETDPIGLQMVSGGIAVPIMIVMIWFGGEVDFNIGAQTWGLLIILGLLGTLAHLLLTWSLRYAPSATLAPIQYLEIPFATLLGWLVFNDLPNGMASVGIAITIGAGLYIVFREQAMSAQTEAPG